MANYKNFSSVNPIKDAFQKEWCISAKVLKSYKQAVVVMKDGKEYAYASRYPVQYEDIAVIGKTCADFESGNEIAKTTGIMGVVQSVDSKLSIGRKYAVELDYVFSSSPSKSMIKNCVAYLDLEEGEATLMDSPSGHGHYAVIIYPISIFIRKILAAASVLAFPEWASNIELKKAKDAILEEKILTHKIEILGGVACWCDIDLTDVHVNLGKKGEKELDAMNLPYIKEGVILGYKRPEDDCSLDQRLSAYVNKMVYIGAVSIMVRGGFNNLLSAFLSVNPPIKDFYNEMLGYIGCKGHSKTIQLLKSYAPVD